MKPKSFIALLLLTLPLSLLAACGKEDPPPLDERLAGQEENLEAFEGVITGISKDVYQDGTHILKTGEDEEDVIYLKSPTVNLNQYIGGAVLVRGILKEAKGTAKAVLTVSKIEYADEKRDDEGSEETDQPETSTVKFFENQTLGLKFEHPGTWILENKGETLNFSYEEESVAKVGIFDGENVKDFATAQEEGSPEEVTVAAQQALRFTSGAKVTFYVPNPPKKKIYRFEFTPSQDLELEEEKQLKDQFFDLIQSVELIYQAQKSSGQICGGEPPASCPEGYFCELDDASEFAEGVCMLIGGGEEEVANCPTIPTPTDCADYQISDYTLNGCPAAYECTSAEGGGHFGTDFVGEEIPLSEGSHSSDLEVSQGYTNDKLGFSMNYPDGWYYASFGPVDGSEGTIGFASHEFEEVSNSEITLSLQSTDGGKASKKIGDTYYVFDGPASLTGVMEEMAESLR